MRRSRKRSRQGASVILVALSAVAFIALLYAAFQYFVVMGGSIELRNAVDAAALNVSKRVVEIKVPANDFSREVADSSGNISATNINRVWGKACLINANEQSMQSEGLAGNSAGNAEQAYQFALDQNNQLHLQLTDKGRLDFYFNQIAANRKTKMLGTETTAQTGSQSEWASALVDRGEESNLSATMQQFPPGVQLDIVKRGNRSYMKGYTPIRANNKVFCFVPYRVGEMPHLISDILFEKNRVPISGVDNPIPNAFKEAGMASGNQATLQASACAVVNPQVRYTIAIPHSYVRITFVNRARWFVEGKQYPSPIKTYPNYPQDKLQGVKDAKLTTGGFLNGYGNLGYEYKQGSLWFGLNALPGDHMPALMRVVQRVQEIDPNFSIGQLKALLMTQTFSKDPEVKYLIFPTYNTPDNSDPKIQIQPDTGSLPGWLSKTDADGDAGLVMTEPEQKDDPNTCTDLIYGGQSPTGKHWTMCSGQVQWRPGTGMGQCLGELTVARTTDLYFTGVP